MEWILMTDRKPDESDADEYGCVIVWHLLQGAMIVGFKNAVNGRYHTHWMPTPEAPINAKDMRAAIEEQILGSRFKY